MKKKILPVLCLVLFVAVGCCFLLREPLFDAASHLLDFNRGPTEEELARYGGGHYFSLLSDTQARAYITICEHLPDYPEKIYVPVLSEDEFNRVHTAILYDRPELFYLGSSCTMIFRTTVCVYQPTYIYSREERDDMLPRLEEARREIYASIPADADEYTREKAVHDALIRRCTYASGEDDSDIYAALVNGRAVCAGYAKAVKYLLDGLSVENFLVTGTAGEPEKRQSHMWNIVTIDGKPYCLDVTWDDGDYDDGSAGYAYFNVTEKAIGRTHFYETDADHGCVFTDANFYVREGRFFNDPEDADFFAAYEDGLRGFLSSGGTNYSVAFPSKKKLETAVRLLIEEQRIYKILQEVGAQTGVAMDSSFVNCSVDKTMYILTIDFSDNILKSE